MAHTADSHEQYIDVNFAVLILRCGPERVYNICVCEISREGTEGEPEKKKKPHHGKADFILFFQVDRAHHAEVKKEKKKRGVSNHAKIIHSLQATLSVKCTGE